MKQKMTYLALITLTYLVAAFAESNADKKAWACEGMQTVLVCHEGSINVTSARYGFFGQNCNHEPEHNDIVCYDKTARKHVSYLCQGRHFCTINVSSKVFENPCAKFIQKHLEINYNCGHK